MVVFIVHSKTKSTAAAPTPFRLAPGLLGHLRACTLAQGPMPFGIPPVRGIPRCSGHVALEDPPPVDERVGRGPRTGGC